MATEDELLIMRALLDGADELRPFRSCEKCGAPGTQPICFHCFMGRPFKRECFCALCKKVKPIVRQYMNGAACDECNAERTKGWRQ